MGGLCTLIFVFDAHCEPCRLAKRVIGSSSRFKRQLIRAAAAMTTIS